MLVFPPNTKIYLCTVPTDMRKSFQTLASIVVNNMNLEPADGSMYVFWNKAKNKLKILQWVNKGFWLHYNRLAEGTFFVPNANNNNIAIISSREMYRLLAGIDLTNITSLDKHKNKKLL